VPSSDYPLVLQQLDWFVDSCSHYAAADVGQKYAVVQGTPQLVDGRTAGSALRFDGGATSVEHAFHRSGAARTYLAWGGSVYVHSGTWGATTSIALVQGIYDATPALGTRTELTQIRLRSDGTFAVSDPTTVVATGTGALPFDTWVFLEIALRLGDGAGTPGTGRALVRVDGDAVLDADGITPVDVGVMANPQLTRVRFGNQDGGNAVRVDVCDLYTHLLGPSTSSGGTFESQLTGYRPVRAYLPTSGPATPGGGFVVWTPVGAATNLEAVGETIADNDAAYVRADGGTDAQDVYTFGAPPLPADQLGSILSYNGQLCALVRGEAALGGLALLRVLFGTSFSTIASAQPLTTYFYARSAVAHGTVPNQETYGYQYVSGSALRVSQLVLELRGGGGRSWVATVGT
jgi:hypothetical protein